MKPKRAKPIKLRLKISKDDQKQSTTKKYIKANQLTVKLYKTKPKRALPNRNYSKQSKYDQIQYQPA